MGEGHPATAIDYIGFHSLIAGRCFPVFAKVCDIYLAPRYCVAQFWLIKEPDSTLWTVSLELRIGRMHHNNDFSWGVNGAALILPLVVVTLLLFDVTCVPPMLKLVGLRTASLRTHLSPLQSLVITKYASLSLSISD